ncbi:hypothetical protein ANN_19555 [Periplaneta americana]|uniref:Uncharacterized protein n=1 Tax=Periplaneta americana TaxID=6978 RepID=A0ABQ8SA67_PERAM|nr:hypothetical protein ANN_19555 [Periplaneta americana]
MRTRTSAHSLTFPAISDSKIKEGVLNGPQIREIMKDNHFESLQEGKETAVWIAFKDVELIFWITVEVHGRHETTYRKNHHHQSREYKEYKAERTRDKHHHRCHDTSTRGRDKRHERKHEQDRDRSVNVRSRHGCEHKHSSRGHRKRNKLPNNSGEDLREHLLNRSRNAHSDEDVSEGENGRLWIHELNATREEKDEFYTLVQQIIRDEKHFYIYFKMTAQCFDEILGKRLEIVCTPTGHSFRVGFQQLVQLRWKFVQLCEKTLNLNSCQSLHDDYGKVELNDLKKKSGFPNHVDAIDGKHVTIKCPDNAESDDGDGYEGTDQKVNLKEAVRDRERECEPEETAQERAERLEREMRRERFLKAEREMAQRKELYRHELEARRERMNLEKEKERTLEELAKKRDHSSSPERKKLKTEEVLAS